MGRVVTYPRFHIDPGDVPAVVAARRLGLSVAQFEAMRAELEARGFPKPDPTTGNWDLDAIDEWRRRRHPGLFLTTPERPRDARTVNFDERIGRILGNG